MTTRRARATYRHDASSAGLIGGASGGPATGPTPAAVPRHPAYHGSAGATAAAGTHRPAARRRGAARCDASRGPGTGQDRRGRRGPCRSARRGRGRGPGHLGPGVRARRLHRDLGRHRDEPVRHASERRVAAAAAFEEAAIAEVVSDLVDEHTVEVLRSSAGNLFRLKGLPTPGSLSNLASPRGGVSIEGPLLIALIAAVFVSMMAIFVGLFAVGLVGIAAAAVIASRLARKR